MKISKGKRLLCLLAFTWLFVNGQPSKHFGVDQGLPTNTVYRVQQDAEGFIWITHNKGLSRFDGRNFTHFSTQEGLPTNDIWNMDIDAQNRVWFFSKANQLGYIQNGRVFNFSNREGISFYPQNIYKTGKGIGFYSAYVGELKYFRFNKDHWQALNNTAKNLHLIDLNKKYYWIQGNQSLIVADSTGRHLLKIPFDGAENRQDFRQVNDSTFVALSSAEAVFINTNRLQYKKYRFNVTLETGRISNNAERLLISGKGNLWVFDSKWQLIRHLILPPEFNDTFNYLDKDGNLWSASVSDGLYFIPGNVLSTKTYFKGESIKKVIHHQGQILIYHETLGLMKKKSGTSEFEPIHQPGAAWNLTPAFDGKSLVYVNDHNLFYTEDPDAAQWSKYQTAYYLKNLSRYQNAWYSVGRANIQLTDDFSAAAKFFPYNVEDQISGNAGHLYWGGINGLKILKNQQLEPFDGSHQLTQKNIVLLQAHNDSLMWVGTERNGLYLTNGNQSKQLLETNSNKIVSVYSENAETVWVLTDENLYRLKSIDFWNYRSGLIEVVGRSNPLLSDNLSQISVLNDTVYLASDKGLHVLEKNQLFSQARAKFYVEKFHFSHSTKRKAQEYLYEKNGNLTIQMGAIDYTPAQDYQFQYKMSPSDNNWLVAENGNITLSGLNPGSYAIALRAAQLPEQTQVFTFRIRPLWWQTSFFTVAALLLLILSSASLAGYMVKRYFVLKNKRLENIRLQTEHELHALRSQMNPHFIFNSLNAIQFYLNKKGPELSEKYLLAFSKLIRMIFEYSGKKTITLTQEIDLLSHYLEIEKMRFDNRFSYLIYVDEKIDKNSTSIPSLLLQSIVENAVNHGIFHSKKEGLIEIKFLQRPNHTIEIIISDNGIGIKKSKALYQNSIGKSPSKSTAILKSRIALINQTGRFFITYHCSDLDPENQSGTQVILKIKTVAAKNTFSIN